MLATRVPLAATAGTPMPGQTESPVHTSPGKGVFGPAKVSRPEGRVRAIHDAWRIVGYQFIRRHVDTNEVSDHPVMHSCIRGFYIHIAILH